METKRIEIRSRWNDSVLFAHEAVDNTLAITLAMAIKAGADLRDANLSGANLSDAYLRGANLRYANLSGADLREGITLSGRRPYLQIGPIGSRNDYLQSYVTDKGIYLRAECFFGTRDEFALALDAGHGNNEHGQEYRAALALIDAHAKLFPADSVAEKVAA